MTPGAAPPVRKSFVLRKPREQGRARVGLSQPKGRLGWGDQGTLRGQTWNWPGGPWGTPERRGQAWKPDWRPPLPAPRGWGAPGGQTAWVGWGAPVPAVSGVSVGRGALGTGGPCPPRSLYAPRPPPLGVQLSFSFIQGADQRGGGGGAGRGRRGPGEVGSRDPGSGAATAGRAERQEHVRGALEGGAAVGESLAAPQLRGHVLDTRGLGAGGG